MPVKHAPPKWDRKFVPEYKKPGFEIDAHGRFRIYVYDQTGKKHYSTSTPYEHIAVLNLDGVRYMGVTAYWEGVLPHEQVLLVVPMTEQEKAE